MKKKEAFKKIKDEDKMYHKDFWKTAKSVTEGTFGKPVQWATFEKSTADAFYKNRYEQAVTINPDNLIWFQKVKSL